MMASLLTLISTFWRKDNGTQMVDQYEIQSKSQSMKNSAFLCQSGLLAGSMILQTDEKLGSASALSIKHPHIRRPDHAGLCESKESLFRNVIVRKLETDIVRCNSQDVLCKVQGSDGNEDDTQAATTMA
jgi:hypothetical protein